MPKLLLRINGGEFAWHANVVPPWVVYLYIHLIIKSIYYILYIYTLDHIGTLQAPHMPHLGTSSKASQDWRLPFAVCLFDVSWTIMRCPAAQGPHTMWTKITYGITAVFFGWWERANGNFTQFRTTSSVFQVKYPLIQKSCICESRRSRGLESVSIHWRKNKQ